MEREIRVWDLPVRLFHWLLVACFAVAYLVAEERDLRDLHTFLGWAATGLIAFRIIWGFAGSNYARFRSFAYTPGNALGYIRGVFSGHAQRYIGHNPAGSYAIYAILLLGLITGTTGYLTLNELGGQTAKELHEASANAWLAVVIAHVAGVIWSSRMHHENLVKGMITGRKRIDT